MRQVETGFSLIEFLIAITIGTLLIATVGSVYISNKTTYIVQEGLARLQENGRYANYLLSRDVRMSGFQGCANIKQVTVTNLVLNGSTLLDFTKPISGYDGGTTSFSPALPSNVSSKAPLVGSDILEIRLAAPTSAQLSADMGAASNPVTVFSGLSPQAGTAFFITNCAVADIFMASAGTGATSITHTTAQNISANLSMAYLRNSMVMRLNYFAYYVKNTGRVNAQNQPVLALVRLDINGNEDEIAEGVERMLISYGVDTNADGAVDTYQTATQVNAANNWTNVISVQIDLLVATVDAVNDKVQAYRFNGATITPTDKKLRREWNTFVTLRNRGLPS